ALPQLAPAGIRRRPRQRAAGQPVQPPSGRVQPAFRRDRDNQPPGQRGQRVELQRRGFDGENFGHAIPPRAGFRQTYASPPAMARYEVAPPARSARLAAAGAAGDRADGGCVARFDRYLLSQLMVLFGFFALILVSIYWVNRAVALFDQLI